MEGSSADTISFGKRFRRVAVGRSFENYRVAAAIFQQLFHNSSISGSRRKHERRQTL